MNTLEMLKKRVSVGRLQAPAPDEDLCHSYIQVAMRAADHGNLMPWRFLFVRDEALVKLGKVFLEAAKYAKPEMTDEEQQRFLSLPLRAPLIIIVIAKTQEHPKIPLHEQLYSAAAAAQNILNAVYATGYGAVWRTGEMASNSQVAAQLGLVAGEQIIGFLYIGTPVQPLGEAKLKSVSDFFSYWS
jgi:nitroreductase